MPVDTTETMILLLPAAWAKEQGEEAPEIAKKLLIGTSGVLSVAVHSFVTTNKNAQTQNPPNPLSISAKPLTGGP